MLILFVKVVFVLMMILVGFINGGYFYHQFGGEMVPDWYGGAMGFGVAVTLLAAEQAFRRRFTRSLVAFILGLAGGLTLSALMLLVSNLAIQDPNLRNNLDVPLVLVTTYMVLITVLRNADRFRVLVPFAEFRSQRVEEGVLVIDPSALRDGRLPGLIAVWLGDYRLLVHRQALIACEAMAGDADPALQVRGRRALEAVEELRRSHGDQVVIDATEVPQAQNLHEVLIGLARLEGCRMVVSDPQLAARVRGEGLRVIDIGAVAAQLAPQIRIGERITVAIERRGESADQGVGHLDDGSMVVMKGAGGQLGQTVAGTVLRLHHSATGRMVFAEMEDLKAQA